MPGNVRLRGPGRRELISGDSSLQPLWRREDARELFYLALPGDRISMMAVDMASAERFAAGRPRELWNAPAVQYPTGLRGRVYDVMPDGKRFVMIQQQDDASQPPITHIVLVQNWVEDLKRLLPGP